MVVGKRLAGRLPLPADLRQGIWLDGQAAEALSPTVKNARLVNLITLADAIVREQHLGYSGNYSFPVALGKLAQAAGIEEGQISGVLKGLIERVEQRAAALGLGQTSSGELYMSALS